MEDEIKTTEIRQEQPQKKNRALPIAALCCDIAVPVLLLFARGFMYTTVLYLLGVLCVIIALVCPFIAIILGIGSLCMGKKQIGKAGIALSIIAIAIPVIAVIVVILLFSTGVAVIRWM